MLKKFKKKVFSTDSQFVLMDDNIRILCVKIPVGKAEYIYTLEDYVSKNEKEIAIDIKNNLELAAISTDEKKKFIYYIHMELCWHHHAKNTHLICFI